MQSAMKYGIIRKKPYGRKKGVLDMIQVKVIGGTLPQEEIDAYIFYTKKKYGTILPEDLEIILEVDGDYVNIRYNPPFRYQVFRGTDYLVNDAEKLNESKLAELRDKIPNAIDG